MSELDLGMLFSAVAGLFTGTASLVALWLAIRQPVVIHRWRWIAVLSVMTLCSYWIGLNYARAILDPSHQLHLSKLLRPVVAPYLLSVGFMVLGILVLGEQARAEEARRKLQAEREFQRLMAAGGQGDDSEARAEEAELRREFRQADDGGSDDAPSG